MNIDIIVVIYNKQISDVPVIRLYENKADIHYYVCDNSTDEAIRFKNKRDSIGCSNLNYIDMKGNKGLSRAYNRALNRCDGEIVCIFDDDTTPDYSYVNQIESQCVREGVYLPLVKSGERLLSPLNKIGPVITRCRDARRLNLKTCSAFNSGMAISRQVAKSIAYDEHLFLDFVDHAFCRKAHSQGVPFYLLRDVVLQQNYSKETNDLQAALNRNVISVKDIAEYYSDNILDKAYGSLYLSYLLLSNVLRYRSLAFLKQVPIAAHRG